MMEINHRCADPDTLRSSGCGSRPAGEPLEARRREIGRCPLCGDMVLAGWEKCPRCGEPLGGCSERAIGLAHPYRQINRKGLLHLSGPSRIRSGAIRRCSLCGDMVSAEWEKCPRCQEPVADSLRP